MTGIDRRIFLRKTAAASGMLLAPSLTGLIACTADRPLEPAGTALPPLKRAGLGEGGYGELVPSRQVDGIISIPKGFHAAILSTAGEEMIGGAVPNAFDGMAAFAAGPNLVRLVRNHELRDTPEFGSRAFGADAYDDKGPGGNTTVEVRVYPSGKAELVKQFASLTGTSTNCAGGSTPWRTWISSEETTMGGRAGFDRAHGYNFEVQVDNDGITRPVPLREMGRFDHEAVAVDPESGFVYQTEDRTPSGFYRFKPKTYGRLKDGGELQILAIEGKPQYNTMTGQRAFSPMKVKWVRIPEPDSRAGELPDGFVFNQGLERGAAQFARLEGCWYGDRSIFFNATSGGDAGAGQIWQYHIGRRELQLVFESPSLDVLNSPDNICVSPRGGLVICEDGSGVNHVRGLTRDGRIFDLVRNNVNASEWAGACFSPQGRTLFVNLQGETRPLQNPGGDKGITFAIWGPWEEGAL
jgi:secreted PhoX family phosphatase